MGETPEERFTRLLADRPDLTVRLEVGDTTALTDMFVLCGFRPGEVTTRTIWRRDA